MSHGTAGGALEVWLNLEGDQEKGALVGLHFLEAPVNPEEVSFNNFIYLFIEKDHTSLGRHDQQMKAAWWASYTSYFC